MQTTGRLLSNSRFVVFCLLLHLQDNVQTFILACYRTYSPSGCSTRPSPSPTTNLNCRHPYASPLPWLQPFNLADALANQTETQPTDASEDDFAEWDALCATLPKGIIKTTVEGLEADY